MNLTPWAVWDPYSGKPGANSRALDVEAVGGPRHVDGLLGVFQRLDGDDSTEIGTA